MFFKKNILLELAALEIDQVYKNLETNAQGLNQEEIENRLIQYGKNDVAREKPPEWYWMILSNLKNPFILVLALLGIVSFLTNDLKGTIVVSIMVTVSVIMRFMQEFRSTRAAEALRSMVRTKATVKRVLDPEWGKGKKLEIPLEELVPGDIVYLSAGDMIPADVRLIRSKDLFISQSALTGESMPVEKYSDFFGSSNLSNTETKKDDNLLDKFNLCFMGTSVVSGFAKAVVLSTGPTTYLGYLANNVLGHRSETSFDKGINKVTWVLIRFILVMIPIIFLLNGYMKENWKDAFLFAIAVAVGLTPEMLPMIVTTNLAKGAVAMSKLKVIVKRLNSIQSFGAMNILCTDKTGTLTQDKIILEKYLDIFGKDSPAALEYGFLNSYFQSGLKNMLDRAILEHAQLKNRLNVQEDYKKIDEIPFDFIRKRMSVVIRKEKEEDLLICKGAIDELLKNCAYVNENNKINLKSTEHIKAIHEFDAKLSNDGFRVIAIAYKNMPISNRLYIIKDEEDLIFLGVMAFLDPPKETAKEAIQILNGNNVQVKVLTGDNEVVTKRVCKEVDLPFEKVLLGSEIESLSDEELALRVDAVSIFAKLTPLQKSRIIRMLQFNGHIVGFLGDGINDAAGLRDSDVGISVDSATDIARESADIILLEKSLLVLGEGVLKGREVYGNIIKYVKMTTSSNFGNVLSVLIASALLPFLPMLPLQILIQNLFYDFSQLSIPWDKMDREFLKKARKWDPRGIARFMVFIGPISSLFDMSTFALLWFVFEANCVADQAFFQTGWFVEGLLSQTLIVHMIRTKKIPFFQSVASTPVIITTLLTMAIGIYFPFSALGASVQLVPLPFVYFIWLLMTLICYCVLAQVVKVWYIRNFKSWL